MRPSYNRVEGRIRGAVRATPPCLHRRPATAGSSLPCLICALQAEKDRSSTSMHRVDLIVSNRPKLIKALAASNQKRFAAVRELRVETLQHLEGGEGQFDCRTSPPVRGVEGCTVELREKDPKWSPKVARNSASVPFWARPISPAYVLDPRTKTSAQPISLFNGSESGTGSPSSLDSQDSLWEQHCMNSWREKPRSGLEIVSQCLHLRPSSPPRIKSTDPATPVAKSAEPTPPKAKFVENSTTPTRTVIRPTLASASRVRRSQSSSSQLDKSKTEIVTRELVRRCSLRIPSPDGIVNQSHEQKGSNDAVTPTAHTRLGANDADGNTDPGDSVPKETPSKIDRRNSLSKGASTSISMSADAQTGRISTTLNTRRVTAADWRIGGSQTKDKGVGKSTRALPVDEGLVFAPGGLGGEIEGWEVDDLL